MAEFVIDELWKWHYMQDRHDLWSGFNACRSWFFNADPDCIRECCMEQLELKCLACKHKATEHAGIKCLWGAGTYEPNTSNAVFRAGLMQILMHRLTGATAL